MKGNHPFKSAFMGLPGSSVNKTSPPNTGDTGLTHGQGIKIPHPLWYDPPKKSVNICMFCVF